MGKDMDSDTGMDVDVDTDMGVVMDTDLVMNTHVSKSSGLTRCVSSVTLSYKERCFVK
jgi:putative salt-induced outer membrane protein YdiY